MTSYSFKDYKPENMSRAYGALLPISFKQSVEICAHIKNRKIAAVKKILEGAMAEKVAIPFNRYNWDLGHKPGIGPGRYPAKASKFILQIVEAAEANAQFKGLNTSNLVVVHATSNKGGRSMHFGRKSRRVMKRTNIEIVLEETKEKKEEKKK
ncbi:MAG: 50S ribosomal protein L22 [Nanoarchaeota archaeon]